MKITADIPQTAPAGATIDDDRAAKKAEPTSKKAPQTPPGNDSVQLSSALDAELSAREIERAGRVAEIKARVAAGEYRVDARALAEKILSGRSDS